MASGTGGFGRQRTGRPYRKRKPLPALILIAILGVASIVVWINAISTSTDMVDAIRCDPRPETPAGSAFTYLPYDALATTPPLPPDQVTVTVLNANGTRGQASITTEALRQLGFTRVTDPGNDEVYANKTEARCHGQVRFGPAGERAARTVHLVDPCLELVRDDRKDASVHLAIGTNFNDARPSEAAVEVLDRLKSFSAENAAPVTDEQSAGRAGPVIDDELLADTLPTHC